MLRFKLQLYRGTGQHDFRANFEAEARQLDEIAKMVSTMAGQPCTIRHDQHELTVYIGPRSGALLIKRPRTQCALTWTAATMHVFCKDVLNDWLIASGQASGELKRPMHREDGNRLPRPVEESFGAWGDRKRINRIG